MNQSPPPTPWLGRVAILAASAAVGLGAHLTADSLGPRVCAGVGILVFIGVAAACSANLRAVRLRPLLWGFGLQLMLAVAILKGGWWRPVPGAEDGSTEYFRPVHRFFEEAGEVVAKLLEFSGEGARFVFGKLADPPAMEKVLGPGNGFLFAFNALPTIIFISSFFTILYYLGVLQLVVRLLSRVMMYLMGTSGAETLSAVANVFMGQTEAPLIVKPYVPRMTQSEMLAMMVGGMATISGGLMAVYIGMGADRVAILATSVMAAPCGLALSKLIYPEMEVPETSGTAQVPIERQHRNIVDAAAAGASDGLQLALNVAAMLIAFLALIALVDHLLGLVPLEPRLSLRLVFSKAFAPVASLLGVVSSDVGPVGDLLGTKLVANEFVAYLKLTTDYKEIQPRSFQLATYALTGFANVASIGIQIGGIGAMAPERRGDLARFGGRALLAGFLTTLINAAVAGLLMDEG